MLISWRGVGGGGGGGGVRVELWSGVVPRDCKSGESVSLGMGHSFITGRESPVKETTKANNGIIRCQTLCTRLTEGRERHESVRAMFSPVASGAC